LLAAAFFGLRWMKIAPPLVIGACALAGWGLL
jgi:hypothetical protein